MNDSTDAMVLEGIKALEFFVNVGRLKLPPQNTPEEELSAKREVVESIYAHMEDKAGVNL